MAGRLPRPLVFGRGIERGRAWRDGSVCAEWFLLRLSASAFERTCHKSGLVQRRSMSCRAGFYITRLPSMAAAVVAFKDALHPDYALCAISLNCSNSCVAVINGGPRCGKGHEGDRAEYRGYSRAES